MSSDRVTIYPVRKQDNGRMRNAARPEDPCADCSGRRAETALAIHLRVACAARHGDIGHAVVEQVFGSQLGIDGDQHTVGGLSLAEMTCNCLAAAGGDRCKSLAGLLFSLPLPRLDL